MEASSSEQVEFFVRFFHPEKLCAALPGADTLSADDHARLYGLGLKRYEEVVADLERRKRTAVTELLDSPGVANLRDHFPFRHGDRILAFGDSITDDLLSWAELLRRLLERLAPEQKVHVINAGVSGDTTAQAVARFLATAEEGPDWIVFMLGTNDARRHGIDAVRSQLSHAETRANLAQLRQMAKARTEARLMWMTPLPVLEGRFAGHWFMGPQEAWYTNRDLEAVAKAVFELPDDHVDLWRIFRERMDEDLYLSDGLHPSIRGQRLILEALLARLTSPPRSEP